MAGYADAEWIDEGELREEGDGEWLEDVPAIIEASEATRQARELARLCALLDGYRREWLLATLGSYQAHIEVLASATRVQLGRLLDECFASELEHVAD